MVLKMPMRQLQPLEEQQLSALGQLQGLRHRQT
jgi:hypothetical protein